MYYNQPKPIKWTRPKKIQTLCKKTKKIQKYGFVQFVGPNKIFTFEHKPKWYSVDIITQK